MTERVSAAEIAQLALIGEAMSSATAVGVFIWDDDRNYVAVNEYACRLVGLPREELLGRKVGFASSNGASPHFEQALRHPVWKGESSFTRPDGAEVELEWVSFRTKIVGLEYMASLVWPRS